MQRDQGEKIAEVVEASSTAFIAQCYQLYGAPPLGSFLRVGEPSAYAVVYNVATGALDPGRRVYPRGAEEAREEDIYRSNPHLARLLSTQIDALIVGHADGTGARPGLPPAPPRLHAFVYPCAQAEVAAFTGGLDFLHLLVRASLPAVDEVIVACLRGAATCHRDEGLFLVEAGKALAGELGADMGRLNALLRRLSP